MIEESRRQNESFQKECLEHIDNKLNEWDQKFAEHERHVDNKIDELDRRFTERERHMEVLIENNITSRLDAFLEYLPGAYKSYEKLEERVDRIEQR